MMRKHFLCMVQPGFELKIRKCAYNGAFNLGDVDSASVEGITVAYTADTSLAASFEEAAGANLEMKT